jgi:hypothetical protein
MKIIACDTCITKAVCLQKDDIECNALRNNILETYNISKFIDTNEIRYFELLLKLDIYETIVIFSWYRNTCGRVKLATTDLIERTGSYLTPVTLRKYITNIQSSLALVKIVTFNSVASKLTKAMVHSPYFKNVGIVVS